jgi:hypothetical protein
MDTKALPVVHSRSRSAYETNSLSAVIAADNTPLIDPILFLPMRNHMITESQGLIERA